MIPVSPHPSEAFLFLLVMTNILLVIVVFIVHIPHTRYNNRRNSLGGEQVA